MNVIKYSTPKEDFVHSIGPIIFLAGPTVRGNQPHLTSWRIEAVQKFKDRGFEGTLILPEFEDKYESDQYRYDLPEWEFAGLEIADVIMFWVPRTRELIGLTTNWEHGYWTARDRSKVIYGRPDDAYRIKYSDIMWTATDSTHAVIYNTLDDTIEAALRLVKDN